MVPCLGKAQIISLSLELGLIIALSNKIAAIIDSVCISLVTNNIKYVSDGIGYCISSFVKLCSNILPILKTGFLAHHSCKKESFIFCRDSSFTADNVQIFPPGLLLLFGFNQRCLFLSTYLFLLWADLGLGFGAGFWSFLHALKCAGFSCRTAQAFGRGCSGGVTRAQVLRGV